MQSLRGCHVVVTGASAGVGRATAVAFARLGCRVGLIARGADGLSGARAEVEAAGGQGLVLQADVADAEAVERAAEQAERENGPIDIWVNVAMVTIFSPVSQMTPEEFRRVTEVTYLGQVYGTMAALKRMRRRDRGTIVQVGSALSYRAIPLQSAYCGAKYAIRGFTNSLRSELIHDGSNIRLTMVQLPAVNTPQFDWSRNRMPMRPQPVPPIHQPEAVAAAILEAAAKTPRELWVGIPSVKAIVGDMVLPHWLDHMLASQAYDGQQSNEPDSADRADNLFAPMDGDYGAHGRFDARASPTVLRFEPTKLRMAAAASMAGLAVAILCLGYLGGKRRARHFSQVDAGTAALR
ncbi:SDR family oxidoreductase [Virgifigura deserti]|uniref:SDR family oxidoreductase n=1 Tax=Virgifigura deserti TaxID=2268457 RepID=UPI003CCC3563